MNILLDTHILIWLYDNSSPMKRKTREILATPAHNLFASAVSIWEMSIKHALGRLKTPDNLLSLLKRDDIAIVPITVEHAFAVRSLPLLHGDPFDRMLIVQAQIEDLTIMTHDKQISAYSVSTFLV